MTPFVIQAFITHCFCNQLLQIRTTFWLMLVCFWNFGIRFEKTNYQMTGPLRAAQFQILFRILKSQWTIFSAPKKYDQNYSHNCSIRKQWIDRFLFELSKIWINNTFCIAGIGLTFKKVQIIQNFKIKAFDLDILTFQISNPPLFCFTLESFSMTEACCSIWECKFWKKIKVRVQVMVTAW